MAADGGKSSMVPGGSRQLLGAAIAVLAVVFGVLSHSHATVGAILGTGNGTVPDVFAGPEESPFRGEQPYRAALSTHKYKDSYDAKGFRTYLGGCLPILVAYGLGWLVWPGEHLRHLQILNVMETGGLNFGGGFGQYPQYPVPTAHHDAHSLASRTVRALLPNTVYAFLIGWACRMRVATLDNFSLFLVLLDVLPNLWGAPHVYQRPTHNLRLLVLSISTPTSRSRSWSIIMGLFYLATGLPKCFPAFYRYWLWFGIYPSSTLSLLPPDLLFERGPDGGLHPNMFAQLFGFMAGVMETTLAVLHLLPYSTVPMRKLRCILGLLTHFAIIAGRFDNGLSGWNMSWLLQNLAHSLAPEGDLSWRKMCKLARAVVLAEVALVVLFFSGHGNYHSGMSHHTGNFRMQWLVFYGDSAWDTYGRNLAVAGRAEPCSTEYPTCVHNWNHGTHYPTQNFEAYVYALAGGTSVKDVLPEAVLSDPSASREDGDGSVRAVFLGFASGWSIWDDAFYARWAAEAVRGAAAWRPGECRYVELDRQQPWLRHRWLSVWDLSFQANGSDAPWSLLDGSFGGPPVGRLVEQRPLPVRRPWPGT